MQKKVLAAAIAALGATNTFAANAIIENEYIRAGVNEVTGTLGSGSGTLPGLQYDSAGARGYLGITNNQTGGDYLTPGSPFEGFTVKYENGSGTFSYTNNNDGDYTEILGGAWVGSPSASSAVWAATVPGEFYIKHTYSLPAGQTYIDITTRIDALTSMNKLWFGRFIDPDAMPMPGDTSATDNALGYGAIPARNVVFSEATTSRYALGLYSAAPNVGAGISPMWSSDPVDYYNGGSYTVGTGDDTIGIGFLVNNLSVGDIVTFKYAYIFGPNAFGAASGAVSGGAGGGTPGLTPSGQTLTDVGSATAAASGPTLVSTTTTTRTEVTEAVVTSLPAITGSLAHHTASEGSGVQTIARQTTTAVTTPWLRTTTATPVTTNLYSDGTSTTTDGTPVITEELFNVVDMSEVNEAFSGRIDQHDTLAQLNRGLNRGLNLDPMRRDGLCSTADNANDPECREGLRLFVNGGLATSSMSAGYKADSKVFGLGVDYGVASNWRLGVQANRVTTKMAGVDSLTQQDKNHVGLYSIYSLHGFTLVNNLGYAMDSVNSNRNIEGIFFNSHSVDGNSKWLQNRLYSPSLAGVNPFVGYTYGRNAQNAYTEAGSIQSARAVDAVKGTSSYSEAGVRVDRRFGDFSLVGELSAASDSITTADLSASYRVTNGAAVSLGVTRQVGDNIATNAVALRAVARF